MRILITGANSAIALKLLKAFEGYDVLFADYGGVPTLKTAKYEFVSLGAKNDDTIAHQLLNFCLDNAIDLLLPLHRFEQLPVAKTKVLFSEFNVELLLPDMDVIEQYQGLGNSVNFIILQKGKVLFTTVDKSQLPDTNDLSGAFHINVDIDELRLNLISIH